MYRHYQVTSNFCLHHELCIISSCMCFKFGNFCKMFIYSPRTTLHLHSIRRFQCVVFNAMLKTNQWLHDFPNWRTYWSWRILRVFEVTASLLFSFYCFYIRPSSPKGFIFPLCGRTFWCHSSLYLWFLMSKGVCISSSFSCFWFMFFSHVKRHSCTPSRVSQYDNVFLTFLNFNLFTALILDYFSIYSHTMWVLIEVLYLQSIYLPLTTIKPLQRFCSHPL